MADAERSDRKRRAPVPDGAAGDGPPRRRQRRVFEYGNYDRYYGYRRTAGAEGTGADATAAENPALSDPRLDVLREEWIRGKKCLDIGCNAGALTVAIVQRFGCSSILGIDVDARLIHNARRFVSMLATAARSSATISPHGPAGREGGTNAAPEEDASEAASEAAAAASTPTVFPLSCRATLGRLPSAVLPTCVPAVPPTCALPSRAPGRPVDLSRFPHNVAFKREDVVTEEHAGSAYDVVFCFSVTKWVHLQHGDEGVRALFRKVHRLLRPGGVFVLEPQPWRSYKKKRTLTPRIRENYGAIRMRPKDFVAFLTTELRMRLLHSALPDNAAAGFDRPVHVLCRDE